MSQLFNISSPIAKATAAAPSYTEGNAEGLSQDLSGNLRVAVGSVSANFDAQATAAAPSYTEATANPLSQNLTGDLRTVSKIASGQTLATVTTVGAVTGITNALPAGTNLLGKVGIDQTTNGTTNGVSITGNSFVNITTAATTVVKSGAGVLHSLSINSLGTVASVTTVYDNTAASGTKIATIDSLNLRGTVLYDVSFSTGLTIVTTGTIAPDITVSYR